jgi:hypothetical protein
LGGGREGQVHPVQLLTPLRRQRLLGLIQGGVLALSFTIGGRPGIAAFEVQEDGTLRGSWTTGGGIGTETLTPR